MEKHTYKPIKVHFFCVQPIQIENNSLVELFKIKPNQSALIADTSDEVPEWFNDFNSELYKSLHQLKIEPVVKTEDLKSELVEMFKVGGEHSLAEYLFESCTYLLFDPRFVYFNLVYEIVFDLDSERLKKILAPYPDRQDFYNTVRNILVRENYDSHESKWSSKIKLSAINKIRKVLGKIYGINVDDKSVFIEPSTGNITTFFHLEDLEINNDISQISHLAIELNNIAERLKTAQKPIVLSGIDSKGIDEKNIFNKELYHFNGRFHTVVHKIKSEKYRYMPIQFHMQFMWFYLKKINFILENNYNDMIFCDSIQNIKINTENTDSLINKIETLVMHNEKFKLTIELDNERIYQKIQNRWNIESLLSNSNRYIVYFKEHLSRLYSEKSSKAEQRQNSILLFITLFQFIALLSVWHDYLSLLNDGLVEEASEITNNIITYELLKDINLFLPIGFLVAIFIMAIYVFKRSK